MTLGWLHRVVLWRGHVTKPPWAMRAEAVWWLAHGNVKLARLFWRDAR